MPLTIVIRSASQGKDDGGPKLLTFDGGRVVIGRGPGCDVRLPEPSVSHRHASVRATGSDFTLVDEGSTNGTFVGGVKLSPHAPRSLRSGDLVRVGRVWLEVRMDQQPPTRDLASATRDLALALVADAMQAIGQDIAPSVRVVEGRDAGAVLRLSEEGRTYVVGRGEDCDLPLEDADASRAHLQVVRRGGLVLARDLGSKNPAQLGESTVPADRDVPWKNHLVIRVGRTVLALDEPVAAAMAELENIEDEVVPAGAEPSPPEPPPKEGPESAPKPPAGVAPVTEVKARRNVDRDKRVRPWSGPDIAVVIAAVGVLLMSIAGLYWLLRG